MENKVRIQDDLYEAVNGEWLKNAVIPADKPTTGGFNNLADEVEKNMMAEFDDILDGKNKTDIKEMEYAVKLYSKIIDKERRNKDGINPILPLLNKIKGLKKVADLNNLDFDFYSQITLPFQYGVEADMNDATKNSFIILGPNIILPDTTYYTDENLAGSELLKVWTNMAREALKYTDLSDDEINLYLDDCLKFDELIAKRVKSQLEWADYVKNYNPFELNDVINYLKPFDFKKMLNEIYDKLPNEIVVYDPKAIKEFNLYFNEENFKLFVHWTYINTLLSKCPILSLDLASISTKYRRSLMGIDEEQKLEKKAYYMASNLYSEAVGVYYGRKYFGEEAKKDIIELVKKIIKTYEERIKNNEFLCEETKKKAILKLSTMEIKMGYPDYIHDIYSKLVFNDSDSLYEAYSKLTNILLKDSLNKLYKPVDRTEWAMPGHLVNACYNPSANDITFPAAILQKPFYSINQTISENLGGIGAVIGHEISHAFDNNGAQFDENGNLFNWWTESDYEGFKNETKRMIEQFDKIPYHGGEVNGELVVSENIADNGGMSVTIEIMHKINGNFKEYFENWARIWCMKAKEEYILYLLSNDVHSPAKLRANIPPRNFKEWYETYNVTSDDSMYIEEAKRIRIW